MYAERFLDCSFCGKRSNEVRGLAEARKGRICSECVALYSDVISLDVAGGGTSVNGTEPSNLSGLPAIRTTSDPETARRLLLEYVDTDSDPDVPSCKFCGKSREAVRKLIVGPGVNICDECVALCAVIIRDIEAARSGLSKRGWQAPVAFLVAEDRARAACSCCHRPRTSLNFLIELDAMPGARCPECDLQVQGPAMFCPDCLAYLNGLAQRELNRRKKTGAEDSQREDAEHTIRVNW